MAVTTQQLVAGAYSAVYDRAPDYVGFNFWTQGLDVNDPASVARFGQNFTNTAVFQDYYDGLLSSGQEELFIQKLYGKIQGRGPDAVDAAGNPIVNPPAIDQNGLKFWSDALKGGLSHGEVFVQFINAALGTTEQGLIAELTAEGQLTPDQIGAVWGSVNKLQVKTEVGVTFVDTLGEKASLGQLPQNPTQTQLEQDSVYNLSRDVTSKVDSAANTATGRADALQLIANSALDGKDAAPVGGLFQGTLGNDVVNLTSADLDKASLAAPLQLLDENKLDRDVIKLAATANADFTKAGLTITNFEALEVDWQSQGQATVTLPAAATGVKEALISKSVAGGLGNVTVNGVGATKLTVGDGFIGNAKINGVGATDAQVTVRATDAKDVDVAIATASKKVTVQADKAETIDVTGVVGGTTAVIAGADAKTVTLAGAGATAAVLSLNLNAASDVTVNTSAVTTAAQLQISAAADKALTLADGSLDGVAKTLISSAGAVELKAKAATLNTKEVGTTSSSAALTVNLTDDAAVGVGNADLTKVKAALVKLTAGTTTLAVQDGQALQIAAATKAAEVAFTAGNNVVATLTSAEYAKISSTAASLTLNAADKLVLKEVDGIAIKLTGAASSVQVEELGAATATLDASNLTGTLTLGANKTATVAATNVEFNANAEIFGAQGGNSFNVGAVAANTEVTFLGNDGVDAVQLNGAVAGNLVLTLGGGNDVVTLTNAALGAGKITIDFGAGDDVLALANGVTLTAAQVKDTLVVSGLETISIDTAATVDASFLSGKAYAVKAADIKVNTSLTINGTADKKVDLSSLTVEQKPTVGGLTVKVDALTAKSEVVASTGADEFSVSSAAGTAAEHLKVTAFAGTHDKLVDFANGATVATSAVSAGSATTVAQAIAAAVAAADDSVQWVEFGNSTYVVEVGTAAATKVVELVGVKAADLGVDNFIVA